MATMEEEISKIPGIMKGIPVTFVSQTVTIEFKIVASTVVIDMNIKSTEIMMPIDMQGTTIMMPVDIQAQYLTLDINIKSQTANIKIDLEAVNATVQINIKTLGETNIVLDLLEQQAYKERRATYFNDEVGIGRATHASLWSGVCGKFFALQTMGFLYKIYVDAKNVGGAAEDATYALSYEVGGPQVKSGTVSIPTGTNWVAIPIYKYWEYDRIFVWFKTLGANTTIGYDTVADFDYWYFSGGNWLILDRRPFIQLEFKGLPISILPIGGVVNNIQIPNLASRAYIGVTSIPSQPTATTLFEVYGAGEVYCLTFVTNEKTMYVNLLLDGEPVGGIYALKPQTLFLNGYRHNTPMFSLICYDTTNDLYVVQVSGKFPFRDSAKLSAWQTSGSSKTITAELNHSRLA